VIARALARGTVEAFLPAGPCVLCGGDSAHGPAPGLCRSCWRARRRPGPPACPTCGLPLPPVEGQEVHPCGECLADPPPYEACSSAFVYRGPVRSLVLLYKDRRRYPLSRLMGRALARHARRTWPHASWDAVVYVPSPWRRRWSRGFESAGLVAREAAAFLGLPCRRWLRPRKAPVAQKGLTRAQRRQNVRAAFTVARPNVQGQNLLLVDDVRTTGATLRECARVLSRAGATVHAATFAVVLTRDLDLAISRETDEASDA
jgi:ComF family protein